MKKITLLLVLFFAISHTNALPKYKRVTKNGGASGYNYTYIRADKSNTIIKCSGPGYEPAPIFGGETDSITKELVNYAMESIASGKLKGSAAKNGKKLKWKSDDTRMTNSVIVVK
jgi:hypothetical protein